MVTYCMYENNIFKVFQKNKNTSRCNVTFIMARSCGEGLGVLTQPFTVKH